MKQGKKYTRAEILEHLNIDVEANARQWGEDYIYTRWAKECRDKRIAAYDAGEVVEVERDEYHENGMDYCDCYYSDGTASTVCYGYTD